jgi:hypothetical protein
MICPRAPRKREHRDVTGRADEDKREPGFFAARLAGRVPLDRLFWTDMMIVGTLINVAAAYGAILMFGFKHPAWAAAAVYLAPLPYNVFLVLCVWRATERVHGPSASAYRLAALGWLAVATLI